MLNLDRLQDLELLVAHAGAYAERVEQLPPGVQPVKIFKRLNLQPPRSQHLRDEEQGKVDDGQPEDAPRDVLAEVGELGDPAARPGPLDVRVPPVLARGAEQRQTRGRLGDQHADGGEHGPPPVDQLALAQFHDVPLRAHLERVPSHVAGHLAGEVRRHHTLARHVEQRGG